MWGTGTKCVMKEGGKKPINSAEKDGKGWMEMETCEVTTCGGGKVVGLRLPLESRNGFWNKGLWKRHEMVIRSLT